MMNRSRKYTISGILTLLTVATTAGISRGGPEGIPAQLTPNINVFRESETVNGVTLEKDAHNIVICPAGTASPIAAQELHQTDDRFWAYEYSGNEPAVLGKFYISWGELLAHPQYASINGLRSFTGGKRYYVMSSITLQFRCNVGLTKLAECGNGRLEGDERCDLVHEGCNQTTCNPNVGYVCQNNVCSVYIPVLGGGSSSTASSQSSRITENWHTECRNGACVTVEGFGAPNQCQRGMRCESSNSSIVDRSRSTASASSASSTNDAAQETLTVIADGIHADADGSAVPTGVSDIAAFRFANAAGNPQSAIIDGIILNVDMGNVVIDTRSLKIYNNKNSTTKAPCTALYSSGENYPEDMISGSFLVWCAQLVESSVQTSVAPNAYETFILDADITNPQLNPATSSHVQVFLKNFSAPASALGGDQSHIRWFDGSPSEIRYRILQPQESISSTLYRN